MEPENENPPLSPEEIASLSKELLVKRKYKKQKDVRKKRKVQEYFGGRHSYLRSPIFHCACLEEKTEQQIEGKNCTMNLPRSKKNKSTVKKEAWRMLQVELTNCDLDRIKDMYFPFSYSRSKKAIIRESRTNMVITPGEAFKTLSEGKKRDLYTEQMVYNPKHKVLATELNICQIRFKEANHKPIKSFSAKGTVWIRSKLRCKER